MNLGARLGDVVTINQPLGRSTPFGTVPRQVGYTVTTIFEVGVYDYDKTFVVMPIPNAQTLLLTGDSIQMIEVKTTDADRVREILAPVTRKLQGRRW
jgi:lipoprotein-releasing system permease protein